MTDLSRLISHRFRGFSQFENTIAGLTAALDFGVLLLEFDIRVSKCGVPMIYHDEYAPDNRGAKTLLSDVVAKDYAQRGGTFARMPTAEDLFKAVKEHPNTSARLLVDIKDAGFETEIHALVCLYGLQSRVTYVSWVPSVLYAMHSLAPDIPLCLSHWCESPDSLTRKFHHIYSAPDGIIPRRPQAYVTGQRSGWFIEGGVKGDMRQILMDSRGSVCVPQNMLSRALVDAYHDDGLSVSAFSYVDWDTMRDHEKRFNIDQYFIDNKQVFDQL